MGKYVKQWDLPCYPNTKALPDCRTLIGLERGSVFDANFKGFSKWMGGRGIGKTDAKLPDALAELCEDVRRRLEFRVEQLEEELLAAKALLQRWAEFPEQFAVNPNSEP